MIPAPTGRDSGRPASAWLSPIITAIRSRELIQARRAPSPAHSGVSAICR